MCMYVEVLCRSVCEQDRGREGGGVDWLPENLPVSLRWRFLSILGIDHCTAVVQLQQKLKL